MKILLHMLDGWRFLGITVTNYGDGLPISCRLGLRPVCPSDQTRALRWRSLRPSCERVTRGARGNRAQAERPRFRHRPAPQAARRRPPNGRDRGLIADPFGAKSAALNLVAFYSLRADVFALALPARLPLSRENRIADSRAASPTWTKGILVYFRRPDFFWYTASYQE